jgi:hypothetical protein
MPPSLFQVGPPDRTPPPLLVRRPTGASLCRVGSLPVARTPPPFSTWHPPPPDRTTPFFLLGQAESHRHGRARFLSVWLHPGRTSLIPCSNCEALSCAAAELTSAHAHELHRATPVAPPKMPPFLPPLTSCRRHHRVEAAAGVHGVVLPCQAPRCHLPLATLVRPMPHHPDRLPATIAAPVSPAIM